MVRDILKQIAADESDHAQLAWNTVQWAVERFPHLRIIAEETFEEVMNRPVNAINNASTEYCYDCERDSALRDHGLLLDADQHITDELGVQNVIKPAIEISLKMLTSFQQKYLTWNFQNIDEFRLAKVKTQRLHKLSKTFLHILPMYHVILLLRVIVSQVTLKQLNLRISLYKI